MELSKISRVNTTTVFLLPLIDLPKGVFEFNVPRKGRASRLFNAYLFDLDVGKYQKDHISVVHFNYQDVAFKSFESTLTSNEQFRDSYDISNSEYSVKVFEIPKDALSSYEAFKRGHYSLMAFPYQIRILYYNYLGDKNYLEQVLQKDPLLKAKKEAHLGVELGDNELWSIYDPEYDILTPEIKQALITNKLKPNIEFLNEH